MSSSTASKPVHVLDIAGVPLNDASAEVISRVKAAVFEHGVVCIPGQSVSAKGLTDVGALLGTLVTAAVNPFLYCKSEWVHDTVDDVFLAGNVDRHGKTHTELTRSEYWHHDLDFCPEKMRRCFNILQTVIMPSTPGPTAFIDVRDLRANLTPDEESLLCEATVTVHLADIADYDSAAGVAWPLVTHAVLSRHPASGLPVAYMPAGVLRLASGRELPHSLEVFQPIIDRQPRVVHSWRPGDILVWDNLSVMHRSVGGYSGSRLLYRVQSMWEA